MYLPIYITPMADIIQNDSLNLSILLREGKETNKDSRSNGE